MGVKASKAQPVRHMEYCGFDISALPEELFMHVLLFVPPRDVVTKCSLVNRYWLQISRSPTLWKKKCEHDKISVTSISEHPPQAQDFMKLYFQRQHNTDLLRNPSASGRYIWFCSSNQPFGDSTCLNVHYGAERIKEYIPADMKKGEKVGNFTSSFRFPNTAHAVNLSCHISHDFLLNEIRPPLEISAQCLLQLRPGTRFQLEVRLYSAKGKEVGGRLEERVMPSDTQRGVWQKASYVLKDYPPGVEILVFRVGDNTQFLLGCNTAEFGRASVRFLSN